MLFVLLVLLKYLLVCSGEGWLEWFDGVCVFDWVMWGLCLVVGLDVIDLYLRLGIVKCWWFEVCELLMLIVWMFEGGVKLFVELFVVVCEIVVVLCGDELWVGLVGCVVVMFFVDLEVELVVGLEWVLFDDVV